MNSLFCVVCDVILDSGQNLVLNGLVHDFHFLRDLYLLLYLVVIQVDVLHVLELVFVGLEQLVLLPGDLVLLLRE